MVYSRKIPLYCRNLFVMLFTGAPLMTASTTYRESRPIHRDGTNGWRTGREIFLSIMDDSGIYGLVLHLHRHFKFLDVYLDFIFSYFYFVNIVAVVCILIVQWPGVLNKHKSVLHKKKSSEYCFS